MIRGRVGWVMPLSCTLGQMHILAAAFMLFRYSTATTLMLLVVGCFVSEIQTVSWKLWKFRELPFESILESRCGQQ